MFDNKLYVTPWLYGLVDNEAYKLNDEDLVLYGLDLTFRYSLQWLNMTVSVGSQLEVVKLLSNNCVFNTSL
jgi:aryl carrier-like protein